MLKTVKAAAAALIAACAVALATPAAAQGTTTGPVAKPASSSCPTDWSEGGKGRSNQPMAGYCYPDLKLNGPAIYARASADEPCAAGYHPEINRSRFCTTKKPILLSAETNLAQPNRLTKPSPEARCPTGWASAKDLKTCYTTLSNAPAARLSKGKPCAPGELAEWGLWCTPGIEGVTYAHADGHASKDFNEVYLYLQMNGGDWESMKCCLSPAAEAFYKAQGKGPQAAAASQDGPGDYTSAAEDEARGMAAMRGMVPGAGAQPAQAQCTAESGAGAAIGGAVGGEAGARIGGMLGGLGKKKKKNGC